MNRDQFRSLAINDSVSHPILRDAVTVSNQYIRVIDGMPKYFVWLGPTGYEVSEDDFIVTHLYMTNPSAATNVPYSELVARDNGVWQFKAHNWNLIDHPYRIDDWMMSPAMLAQERASEAMVA